MKLIPLTMELLKDGYVYGPSQFRRPKEIDRETFIAEYLASGRKMNITYEGVVQTRMAYTAIRGFENWYMVEPEISS